MLHELRAAQTRPPSENVRGEARRLVIVRDASDLGSSVGHGTAQHAVGPLGMVRGQVLNVLMAHRVSRRPYDVSQKRRPDWDQCLPCQTGEFAPELARRHKLVRRDGTNGHDLHRKMSSVMVAIGSPLSVAASTVGIAGPLFMAELRRSEVSALRWADLSAAGADSQSAPVGSDVRSCDPTPLQATLAAT